MRHQPPSSPSPFYYLANFQTVLEWIAQRHHALLTNEEQAFIAAFRALPIASQALLVRMIMRKGELFRSGKLRYPEIGDTATAVQALIAAEWLDDRPALSVEQLFALLRKNELSALFDFPTPLKNARKAEQLAALLDAASPGGDATNATNATRAAFAGLPLPPLAPRPLDAWYRQQGGECIYHLRIRSMCERFRLMFFGNLHQDWSEFVLSELGIFKYEKVALSSGSHGFRNRRDVDDYLHLHRCRERFHQGEPVADILPSIPATAYDNDWLENRRAKLLFQIAQCFERNDALSEALKIYADCAWPGARVRAIRVLERCGQAAAAFGLAEAAGQAPESEAERQQLSRIVARLRRALGQPKLPAPPTTAATAATAAAAAAVVLRYDLVLERPNTPACVELLTRDHLTLAGAPVLYVENALINSLFGLLCWDAVFAAVPGAFFHPFQSAPADLFSPDFAHRREREFLDCLGQLDSDAYRATIFRNFRDKAGTLSPFVYWDALDEELLTLALDCLPPAHLRKCCERILRDIRANRSGYPDLIQFWPAEKRYRMIEVKGPGDRLQDNQIRWLDYCAAHGMPVTVCYVQWADASVGDVSHSDPVCQ